MASGGRYFWTNHERRDAVTLRAMGLSYGEIAQQGVNRTADAIAAHLRALRLKP